MVNTIFYLSCVDVDVWSLFWCFFVCVDCEEPLRWSLCRVSALYTFKDYVDARPPKIQRALHTDKNYKVA